MSNSVSVVF